MKRTIAFLLAAAVCMAAFAPSCGRKTKENGDGEGTALFEKTDAARAELEFIGQFSDGADRRQVGVFAGRQSVRFGSGEKQIELVFGDGSNGPALLNGKELACGTGIFAVTAVQLGESGGCAFIIDCEEGGWVYSWDGNEAKQRCVLPGLVKGFHDGSLLVAAPTGVYNHIEVYRLEPDDPALFKKSSVCEYSTPEVQKANCFRFETAVRAFSRSGEKELPAGSILEKMTELYADDGSVSAVHYIEFFTGTEYCVTDPAAKPIAFDAGSLDETELRELILAHYDLELPVLAEASGFVPLHAAAFTEPETEFDVDLDGKAELVRFEQRAHGVGDVGLLQVDGLPAECPNKIDSIGTVDLDPSDGITEFFVIGDVGTELTYIYRLGEGGVTVLFEFYGVPLGTKDGMLIFSRRGWLGGPGAIMTSRYNSGAARGREFGPVLAFDTAGNPMEAVPGSTVIKKFRAFAENECIDIPEGSVLHFFCSGGSPLPGLGSLQCFELNGEKFFVLIDEDGHLLNGEPWNEYFKIEAPGR